VIYSPSVSLAQSPHGAGGKVLTLNLSAIQQFRADIGDSRMDFSGYRVKADLDLVKSRKLIMSLGTSYDVSEYKFAGQPADPWSDPWGSINSTDVGLRTIFPGSGKWSYFLAGSLDWSWEEGASAPDGLVYGIITSGTHSFRYDRRLGLGIGVFNGLEELKIFAYPTVSWRFNENLTLKNPLQAGPVGPAGLELVYNASNKWEIGSGAAYRSLRFRLDGEGIGPDGFGDISGIPMWFRTTHQSGSGWKFGLYAGIVLSGDAVVEDRDGRRLQSRHFDPAPLAALTLERDF
jgi:hypothetical protein